MKISAIICEYNPLHAGHIHHISETRRLSGADKIICIMSGSFVERGEPSVFDKFSRAKAALMGGADMVIELPTSFACASAERFAEGGVMIVNSLGIVTHLSFGCENADISALKEIAELLVSEPCEYKDLLKKELSEGKSFPAARAKAISSLIPEGENIINKPNNILAIEYLKALIRQNSKIIPVAVKREGSGYNEKDLSSTPSALAVRTALKDNKSLEELIPEKIADCFKTSPVFAEDIFLPLLYKLRTMSLCELENIAYVEEGLSYKIKEAAKTAKSYDELVGLIKSKRYTETRIKRILVCTLLGIDKKKICEAPSYIRVLGVRKESRELLSLLSEKAAYPIVTSPADFTGEELKLDILATDIRSMLEKPVGKSAKDYTSPLIVI